MPNPLSNSRLWQSTDFGQQSVLAIAAATLLFVVAVTPCDGAESVGRVSEIKGEAFVGTNDQLRSLDRSSPLYVNDKVGTGQASRLTMRLGKDTTVHLGEQAHLVIDRFVTDIGGEITLESGPMLFDRPDGSPRMPVQIKSTYGLIAVRGTRFFAGPSNGVFGVFVDHGTVTVSSGGASVVLRDQQGTNITSPGSQPTAPVTWGAPRIRDALNSVQ